MKKFWSFNDWLMLASSPVTAYGFLFTEQVWMLRAVALWWLFTVVIRAVSDIYERHLQRRMVARLTAFELPRFGYQAGGFTQCNPITTRPPEGLSRSPADGRSDARRSERSDGPHRAAVDAPAAASDLLFPKTATRSEP